MSHGCGNLRLMTSVLPLASGLRLHSSINFRTTSPPHPPHGNSRRLQPPSDVTYQTTRLAGVTAGTLREDPKAHPQQLASFDL
jgi:hypothetical protein